MDKNYCVGDNKRRESLEELRACLLALGCSAKEAEEWQISGI
jgi:hypothetical protein